MSDAPSEAVVAVITARGGSKGLPRKNILPFAGKPLIAWTIEAALAAQCVGRVILSSEDDEVIAAARDAGCEVPFRRPADLASDEASSLDVVLHALDTIGHEGKVVLLQPTSPLRNAEDIDRAFAVMERAEAPSCVSVCEAEQSPYLMFFRDAGATLKPVIPDSAKKRGRRQDMPRVYRLNGAIYICEAAQLRSERTFLTQRTCSYVMPKETSIDIDTRDDFERAERSFLSRSCGTS